MQCAPPVVHLAVSFTNQWTVEKVMSTILKDLSMARQCHFHQVVPVVAAEDTDDVIGTQKPRMDRCKPIQVVIKKLEIYK